MGPCSLALCHRPRPSVILVPCVCTSDVFQPPMESFHLQHPERLWMAALWLGLIVILLLWGYVKSPLTGWRRLAAAGCKALAAILLAACLLDPVRVTETPKKGANELVILADNSASLAIAEKPGDKTRGEQLRAALSGQGKDWAPWLEKLRSTFRVRLQSVDERVHGISDATELNFGGRQSAIASAVKAARDRAGSSVAAVVVLSDGNATDAAEWNVAPNDTSAPVFSVLAGEVAPERDLSLAEVSALQTTFEDSPVSITAKVTHTGFAGVEVAVRVLDEAGKVLTTEKHKLDAQQPQHVFRLRLAVAKPGVSIFKVVVGEVSEDKGKTEATLANNERYLAVDRGAGPYRVLYIAGRPNWDFKFLRRAIALDPEVQMPSLIRIAKREPKFDFRGRSGETSNPLFRGFAGEQQTDAQRYDQPVLTRFGMKDKEELVDGFPKNAETLMSEYRAIIIDDLEAEFFTQEQMNLIERFVSQRGGSLLMLGGVESFGAGGYDNTPVGRMLPVYLDKRGTSEHVQDAKFDITREGWLEPWTRLRSEQDQDEQRLAQMPAFWAVNQSTSIKPGATILASVTDAKQRRFPALVMQRYGTGRTVALTIGDLWRWGMKDAGQHADMDKAWRQLLRWMVLDVPDRIELQAKLSQAGGQSLAQVAVRVHDAAFRPQDDASVQVEVQSPGEKPAFLFAEPSLKEPGLFDAEHYPRAAGGYRVKATVKDGAGKVLGEKSTGFALNPLADEMTLMAPNRAFMERLASDSGGQFLALKDVAKLADILPGLEMPQMERKSQPLWHSPWWMIAVLALLVAEWALRRSVGVI